MHNLIKAGAAEAGICGTVFLFPFHSRAAHAVTWTSTSPLHRLPSPPMPGLRSTPRPLSLVIASDCGWPPLAEKDVQMRLELCRSHLEILPEGEADLAYIEDTLGLRQAGNQIPLIRLDYGGGRTSLIRLVAGNNLRAQASRRKTDQE
jgi:hypothetical protein